MNTNTTTNEPFEPSQIRLATVVFRTFAGLFGGIIGSAVIFLIFMLTQSTLQGLLTSVSTDFNPVFIFIVLAMAFLGTQLSAISSTALISYTQTPKYTRLTSTLVQVFMANLIIFLLLIPGYIVISQLNTEAIMYVAAIHIFFSGLISTLIMEIIADYRYAILGVYSSSIATLIAITLMLIIQTLTPEAAIIPLLLILPITWSCLALCIGVGEMIYWWLYETYGVDYLSLTAEYGDEGSTEETAEDTPEEIFSEAN